MDEHAEQPAWAKFQAAKTPAQIAARDAFYASLDRFPASSPALTPAQQARHDELEELLKQCAHDLNAGALSWLYMPQAKQAEPAVTPVAGGYTAWFDKEERAALSKVMPQSRRANGTNYVELLDYMLAAATQAQPLSRIGGDARSAQFRRAAARGVWDDLLSAILAGELDDLMTESRRTAITRVAKNGVKAREQEQARTKLRQAAADGLAKSRRTGKSLSSHQNSGGILANSRDIVSRSAPT